MDTSRDTIEKLLDKSTLLDLTPTGNARVDTLAPKMRRKA
jgi:hypothetical protein